MKLLSSVAKKVAHLLKEDVWNYHYASGYRKLDALFKLDHPHISNLLPYRYYDDTNELLINTQSLGFGLELAVLSGADEKLIEGLADFFRHKLSEKIDIQFIFWGHTEIQELLDRGMNKVNPQDQLAYQIYQASRHYYEKAAINQFVNRRNLPLPLRDYRVFCFGSIKGAFSTKQAQALLTIRADLESQLIASGISFIRLDDKNFLRLMRSWLSIDRQQLTYSSDHCSPHETLDRQIVDPDLELFHYPNHIELNSSTSNKNQHENNSNDDSNSQIITLSLKSVPDQFALWMFPDNFANVFRKTQSLTCPFIISISARLISQVHAKSMSQRRFLDFDKKSRSSFAKYIANTAQTAQEWKKIRDELHADTVKLTEISMNVVLFTNAKKARQDQTNAINSFRFNGIELYNTRYLQLQSYLSVLPFLLTEGLYDDFKRIKRLKTVTTWNLANLLPIVADFKGGRHGIIIPSFRHQLSFFDPFDSSLQTNNYNIAVAATSGAGKSFLIQSLCHSIIMQGGKVWVIDIGGSYKNFCEVVGGCYLGAGALSLNPFSQVNNIQISGERIRDLLAVMASPNTGLSDVQLAYLLDAVKFAWESKKNSAKVDDVIYYLKKMATLQGDQRIIDLVTLLSKYSTTGNYATYFNDQSSLDSNHSLVVLELGELESQPDLMKAVLFALILFIEESMYQSPRNINKLCVIDEAWRHLNGENKEAANFIEKGFRTARKHQGSFCTIVQSIKDFHQSREAKAAWNNADIKFILRQNDKAFKEFLEEFPDYFTPYEQILIKGFGSAKDNGFSEFLLQIGSHSSFHRLFVDPFIRVMYSSDGNDVATIRSYCNLGMTIAEAVLKVAKDKYPDELI